MIKYCELCKSRYEPEKDYFVLCDACYQKSLEPTSQEISVAIAKRYALFDFRCCYCNIKKVQCWDHVVPRIMLSRYLANRPPEESFRLGMGSNLVPACKSCNSAKAGRDLIYFYVHSNWNNGGRARLAKIVLEHSFAPLHWLDFLDIEEVSGQKWYAWRQVEERSKAWCQRFNRDHPLIPFPAVSAAFKIGDSVYHDFLGHGTVIDYMRDVRSSDETEEIEMLMVSFYDSRYTRGGDAWILPSALRHPSQESDPLPKAVFPEASFGPKARKEARATSFRAGDRVRHAIFGVGIVIGCTPAGTDEEVTVVFPGGPPKTLLASFARLQVVEEGT